MKSEDRFRDLLWLGRMSIPVITVLAAVVPMFAGLYEPNRSALRLDELEQREGVALSRQLQGLQAKHLSSDEMEELNLLAVEQNRRVVSPRLMQEIQATRTQIQNERISRREQAAAAERHDANRLQQVSDNHAVAFGL